MSLVYRQRAKNSQRSFTFLIIKLLPILNCIYVLVHQIKTSILTKFNHEVYDIKMCSMSMCSGLAFTGQRSIRMRTLCVRLKPSGVGFLVRLELLDLCTHFSRGRKTQLNQCTPSDSFLFLTCIWWRTSFG